MLKKWSVVLKVYPSLCAAVSHVAHVPVRRRPQVGRGAPGRLRVRAAVPDVVRVVQLEQLLPDGHPAAVEPLSAVLRRGAAPDDLGTRHKVAKALLLSLIHI